MLYDRDGNPLAPAYAEALATHVGYGPKVQLAECRFLWNGPAAKKGGAYFPHITTGKVEFRYYTSSATFSLYLLDEGTDAITCRMLGEPFSDDDLLSIIGCWSALPYSVRVGKALLDQADWLDDHPMYRGIPVKQSKTKRYAPGTLETA